MSNEIVSAGTHSVSHLNEFTREKLELLKATICRGSSDDEFQLFVHTCKRTGLDPFMRQIYAVKRWDSGLKREAMAIQIGIDGFRAIADKSGRYAPGRETVYQYDKNGELFSATAFVKKQTADGTWHEVSATAFWAEYVAKTKDGQPTHMWREKRHIMLGKCAESLCLRKAFPNELSGLYTTEEMEQASNGGREAKAISIEEDLKPELNDAEIDLFIMEKELDKLLVEKYIEGFCRKTDFSKGHAFWLMKKNPDKFRDGFNIWLAQQKETT